jgi:hypothetical protein
MFPNPQDALPLPPRPNLERYKKLAKSLVQACRTTVKLGDENAIGDWAEQWIRSLADKWGTKLARQARARLARQSRAVEDFARRRLSGAESAGRKCALTAAQFVIARSHGFESWPKFAKHLEALARKSTPVSRFEAAADAIVAGDVATLNRLLREDPALVHARSTREHGATLLHYVSANGVEGYRQRTPKNIVAIAGILLQAGAEIDATTDVYGGGCTTLGLAATSVHPEIAGVQEPLLQLLLHHGARTDLSSAGNRHSLVTACIANGRPKAAAFLASRGAPLDLPAAAAVGRLDIVENYFAATDGSHPHMDQDVPDEALLYACGHGRNEVVEFLLKQGADLGSHSGDGQTPLHWAVIGGHLDTARLLLRHNPPLESKNIYGGTVLGQTLWSAAHGGDPDTYIAILDALVSASAKLPERHVPVNARVDAWLAQHGSVAEPTWYWFGEEPRRRK